MIARVPHMVTVETVADTTDSTGASS
jgi:hypothetical protein